MNRILCTEDTELHIILCNTKKDIESTVPFVTFGASMPF